MGLQSCALFQRGVIRLAVMQGAEKGKAEKLVGPQVQPDKGQRQQRAQSRPERLGVAHPPQVLGHRAFGIGRLISGKRIVRPALAPSAAKAASAAIMPVFIALWLPLMRGRFTKPAAQPISAPPGKASFGTD